jgi:quinohemoprotein ethanol dehydrogenase
MRHLGRPAWPLGSALVAALLLASGGHAKPRAAAPPVSQPVIDSGADWAGYGRLAGGQHYSPLAEISQRSVARLGLAWSMDLPFGNSATEPVEVGGVLYFATGLSVIRAVDAASGRLLWVYDPEVGHRAGANLRAAWGVRGLGYGHGKVYVGTADGRLIAVDGRTGKPVWTRQTYDPAEPATISGAPRIFGGRVIVGFGSTIGVMRGYVTAYDADTGRQLWRFWTVPGDPAKGFENRAMAMAAHTWAGEWWKSGGGGTVWNSIAWDAETDTIFIGTGSPYPWNHHKRSLGRGDNLFVSSIVALDGGTGAYKWHYQVSPGDTWDYDATMDIELADVVIAGRPRKVLIQAPKNGFFYVIDRITGKLISAQPYARVTWATRIDPRSGRPVEVPGARFPEGTTARIAPATLGAHNWMPMAYSPKTGLAYIPAIDFEDEFRELPGPWQPPTDRSYSGGQTMALGPAAGMRKGTGSLLAWSPALQKAVWRVPFPTFINGGVLATGGGLVFQGTVDGQFKAYAADSGRLLWRFDAGAPLLAPPITWRAGGHQYVTVLTGTGMGIVAWAGSMLGDDLARYAIDPRTQARRVLTFTLGGQGRLPAPQMAPPPPPDPGFVPDPARVAAGMMHYLTNCATCHGDMAIGINTGPDLRRSVIPMDKSAFAAVVRGGALVPAGMPSFPDYDDQRLEDVRHYLRSRARDLREHRFLPDQSGQQQSGQHRSGL